MLATSWKSSDMASPRRDVAPGARGRQRSHPPGRIADPWHNRHVARRDDTSRRGRHAISLGALLLATACHPGGDTVTIAVALLPSELPVYRTVLRGFERESGLQLVVVPQQYADIRRALAAEASARRGTLDLVELDVY